MADFRIRVGYADQTTARINFVCKTDDPVSYQGPGTAVVYGPFPIGTDNPAEPSVPAGYYGRVEIGGLSANTASSFTLTQAEAIEGSFRTVVADDSTPWSFLMSTCDNPRHHQAADVYTLIRKLVETSEIPVLAYIHIDDISYVDRDSSAPGTTGRPEETGLLWDYAKAWMRWYGLEGGEHAKEDRQWIYRNLPFWAQWGDHEIEDDHCASVWNVADSEEAGCSRADYGRFPGLESTAEAAWDAFIADSCTPPKMREGEQYWAATIGPVRMVAYDRNLHSQPWNACDDGDTHTYGRVGTSAYGTCDGETVPTRTELGVTSDEQPKHLLGQQQMDDILDYYAESQEPFNILFHSCGVSRHNEPWADRWPDEWDGFCYRDDAGGTRSPGILRNDYTNGNTGAMVFLKGDAHAYEVNSYHSNGTAAVLGGAPAGFELWEINAGTINGSWCAAAQHQLFQNGKRRITRNCGAAGNGACQFSGVIHVIVHADRSPKQMRMRLIDPLTERVWWDATWTAGEGNAPKYPAAKI